MALPTWVWIVGGIVLIFLWLLSKNKKPEVASARPARPKQKK